MVTWILNFAVFIILHKLAVDEILYKELHKQLITLKLIRNNDPLLLLILFSKYETNN